MPAIERTVSMRRYLEGPIIDEQKVAALHLKTGWTFAICESLLKAHKGNWYSTIKGKNKR